MITMDMQKPAKRRKLTDKNFGVNITLLPSINPPDYAGYARVAVEEGVSVFETAGNNRECASWRCGSAS